MKWSDNFNGQTKLFIDGHPGIEKCRDALSDGKWHSIVTTSTVNIPEEARLIVMQAMKDAAKQYKCDPEEIQVLEFKTYDVPPVSDWREEADRIEAIHGMFGDEGSLYYLSSQHWGMTHWVRFQYKCKAERCHVKSHPHTHWSDWGMNPFTNEFSCWAD